jgi:hypothetical protein
MRGSLLPSKSVITMILTVVCCHIVLFLCLAAAGPPTAVQERHIDAESLTLRAADGKARAKLFINDEGQPLLSLLDEKGRTQISLSLDTKGAAHFSMGTTDKGIPRLEMSLAEEVAFLKIADKEGHIRTVLGVDADGETSLILADTVGARLGVTADDKTDPLLQFWNHDGKQRISIGDKEQTAGITIFDNAGSIRASMLTDKDQAALLSFHDGEGRPKISMIVDSLCKTSGLTVNDPKGVRAIQAVSGANLDTKSQRS